MGNTISFDTDSTTDWIVTTKRYVGFLDIMGFKDMVARLPHDAIYEMMKKIDRQRKFAESIEWKGLPKNLVKTTTYSDSIIIYSKDDNYESLDSLISSIATLTHYLFLENIPHKGALAFGTMTLDTENSIFFGQPLIDAFLLQEEIQFYGVLIHATVEKEMNDRKFQTPLFIRNYLCKLKNGLAKHLTIYPIHARIVNEKYTDRSIKLFESISRLRLNTSGHLRKYVDNTEAYLEEIKNT